MSNKGENIPTSRATSAQHIRPKPITTQKQGRTLLRWNIVSMSVAIIGTACIAVIPLTDIGAVGFKRIAAYVVAGIFWLMLLVQVVAIMRGAILRRHLMHTLLGDEELHRARPGAFMFFQNPESRVADVIMVASVMLLVCIIALRVTGPPMIIVSVSLCFLSFNAHAILNGKNYRYSKKLTTYMKECKNNG